MERVVGKRAVEGDNVRFTVYGIKRFVLYTGNIGREFIISGFRLVAADNGVVIAASWWGKIKTTVQMVMIGFLIADLDFDAINVIEQILIYASLILTVVSLIDYIYKNKSVLSLNK